MTKAAPLRLILALAAALMPSTALACRCSSAGPPLSEETLAQTVIVLATPLSTESRTSSNLNLPDNPWGLETELGPSALTRTYITFRVDNPLASDVGAEIEISRSDAIVSNCDARIEIGRSGLYVFYRRDGELSLSMCNGGYTLSRMRSYMTTGQDPHVTARDICGVSFYEAMRLPPKERDAFLSTHDRCARAYEHALREFQALNPQAVYGQPVPAMANESSER